jgi:hypothetical protein
VELIYLFSFECVLRNRNVADSCPLYTFCKSPPTDFFLKSLFARVHEFKKHLIIRFSVIGERFSKDFENFVGEEMNYGVGSALKFPSVPGRRGTEVGFTLILIPLAPRRKMDVREPMV